MTKEELWQRFQKYYVSFPEQGLAMDISRMDFDDGFFDRMRPRMEAAFAAMCDLERGAIANPDENRMVGHYWLRNPSLAPTEAIRKEIEQAVSDIEAYAKAIHSGAVRGASGLFRNVLLIGIGGSALGPQFVASALGHPKTDKMRLFFFDNTDPAGMDRVLAAIGTELGHTLTIVISKSGKTRETRNGMLEAERAYQSAGLDFAKHAVAVTGQDGDLRAVAINKGWLKLFPMWDWVGGRTSELSAVGLLPAALQGVPIRKMIEGAKQCDDLTRAKDVNVNPAALLSLMWYHAGNGKGEKAMVVLPYKDSLELFSKYLQQLVMESLGKEKDTQGHIVNQGLTVYGNKGSTDQHAYIQQLRDGINNFFAVFIHVLRDRSESSIAVDDRTTSGDYLTGFYLGTREALFQNSRSSITLIISDVTPFTVGFLIALFERAVGLYATLIGVNAYHQPGVEAGKKAAEAVISLQRKVLTCLEKNGGKFIALPQIAQLCDAADEVETVFHICEHLVANPDRGIQKRAAAKVGETEYKVV